MTKIYIVTHTWWSISGYDDYERNEDEPLTFTSRELAEAYIKRVFDKLVELGDSVFGAFHEDGKTGSDIRVVEGESLSRDQERWTVKEVNVIDNIDDLGEIEL